MLFRSELINKAVDYEQGEENPTLSGFLEEVALDVYKRQMK